MAVTETTATPPADPHNHIPALDGLRGLAVLLVFFNHAQIDIVHMTIFTDRPWADQFILRIWSAGWAGVDLFFVLSGFLITRILLQAKFAPGYFRTFYARRALRIFPLYYLFLVLLMALTHWHDAPYLNTYSGIVRHQAWFWSYLSNYPLALSRMIDAEGFPATHLWTLAIEEQFYLVWPMIVLLLGRRSLMGACAGIVALALGLRVLATLDISESWSAGLSPYYFTPMKLDTLAIGAFIACLTVEPRALGIARRVAPITLVLALAWLVVLGVRYHTLPPREAAVSTFGFSALAFFFGSLVLLVITLRPGHVAARWLSGGTITALGRYSYAFYLFHPLLLGELRNRITERGPLPTVDGYLLPAMVVFALVGLAMSFGLSWLSWRIIEQPILSLKRYFPYATQAQAAAGAQLRPAAPHLEPRPSSAGTDGA